MAKNYRVQSSQFSPNDRSSTGLIFNNLSQTAQVRIQEGSQYMDQREEAEHTEVAQYACVNSARAPTDDQVAHLNNETAPELPTSERAESTAAIGIKLSNKHNSAVEDAKRAHEYYEFQFKDRYRPGNLAQAEEQARNIHNRYKSAISGISEFS